MNTRTGDMFHSKITPTEIRDTLLYAKGKKIILFLGICGTGMSALARMLHKEGHLVLGYDASREGEYQRLRSEGIAVFDNVLEGHLSNVALTVYSLAIPTGHPLIREDIPHCSRAQLLGALMLDFPIRIAVAGAHGKSTVTSLVHRTLIALGEHPTTLSGADLGDGVGPFTLGDGHIFLYECCEYQNSFLYTSPTHSLILNLDLDHTDFFPNLSALQASFIDFSKLADVVLYFAFDNGLSAIKDDLPDCAIPYYLYEEFSQEGEKGEYYGVKVDGAKGKRTYAFYHNGKLKATITPTIEGEVGIYNTLATLTLLTHLGYDVQKCADIISSLPPIARRLERLGTLALHPLYYDFAHHPTEIRATLSTIAERYGEPPVVIFAPHTYSRTRDLWSEFVRAFSLARRVYLCPITAAREAPIEGITSLAFAEAIGKRASLFSSVENCVSEMENENCPIVLMGAGDLTDIKNEIIKMQTFVSI